jgi:serine acetyltransferase
VVNISVLGAGPHGRQVAFDLNTLALYDDYLESYESTREGASLRPWLVGALWPEVRRAIVAKVASAGKFPHHYGIYKAPSAVIGHDVRCASHVHILAGAIVSHGCALDDFVTIATGAKLCGEVHVGEGALIGAGAVIVHGGITIGEGAVVGAGAVVLNDVAPHSTVGGNPARVLAIR